ncbi:merozoite surface [Chlorella sorokiniana]|uniref:Merozoite surface n=1 Tax=Chlorella sorokiniana TaxID=3076 RepID=A0A2P6TGK2_CHLSO|nr:merozoite surface [Chlorella sorokiniana]|eukprot:PRW33230.1 merozoite surface [Chlorella sorokiniana]
MEAEEEVGDSMAVERSPASAGGSLASAPVGSRQTRPPSRHARNQSCPAALMHTFGSSSSLAAMDDEPSTPQWSPALQASMAAWQSATSLMQELQLLQTEPVPPSLVAAPLPPTLLPTPPQQGEQLRQQQLQAEALAAAQNAPAWLHSLLAAQQQVAVCEATSPERGATRSDGAVAVAPLVPAIPNPNE